jgi:hypothetical protein
MEILNLGGSYEPSERPAKKKKLRVIIGIGLLAGVMGMGSTLAASITLNSGASVEFGQGVSYTTACDSNITITPLSTFVNASSGDGGANFALTSVKVGDIDSGCAGKYLRLSAYTDSATVGGAYTSSGSGTSSALAFAMGRTSSAKFGVADTRNNVGPCTITLGATTAESATAVACASGVIAGSISVARSSSKELTLTFSSSNSGSNYYEPILAAAVDKFALESSAS